MPVSTPDYPRHTQLSQYFRDYADRFGLRERFRFDSPVERVEPDHEGWLVTAGSQSRRYAGVVLANGVLAEPYIPQFPGTRSGAIVHSSEYKSGDLFTGKRVLIVGAGNSGCDLAVDAVHRAASVDLSVRRGYYFVPKYLFGKPADTIGRGRPLPARVKQFVDSTILRMFTGDPSRFGFPRPDYRLYESHPIVNSLILQHLGQGDLAIRPDIDRFEGDTVHFADGTSGEYDLVLLATGYKLDYPFIDRRHLSWTKAAPKVFLNIFGADSGSSAFNGIYLIGMIEASGLGWQGRFEQAELLATYLAAPAAQRRTFEAKAAGPWPDLTGGYRYLALDRMSFYVNKHAYLRVIRKFTRKLEGALRGHR